MSKGILIVMTNPPAAMEDEFNVWYDQEPAEGRSGLETIVRSDVYGDAAGAIDLMELYTGR